MKIARVESWKSAVPLSRPYTIASRTIDAVDLFFVRILTDDGTAGLGSASPGEDVTGESITACGAALAEDRLAWLVGGDPRHLGAHTGALERHLAATPAARAAVDMALHDLFARILGVPLVDVLGRCHEALPTSITLGIMSTDEALADARDYLGRGFRCLKVKVGRSLEEDVERLHKLRQLAGREALIRVDANQGYDSDQTRRFAAATAGLDLELIEQPLAAAATGELRALPAALRRTIAADESLVNERDALDLAGEPPACGIWNVKLMKCGGPTAARAIARLAETAGLELMWGCNDESAISIAAALHTAYACPATRYLDLDGSFDLGSDPAQGGFLVENGVMRLTGGAGLGVALAAAREDA